MNIALFPLCWLALNEERKQKRKRERERKSKEFVIKKRDAKSRQRTGRGARRSWNAIWHTDCSALSQYVPCQRLLVLHWFNLVIFVIKLTALLSITTLGSSDTHPGRGQLCVSVCVCVVSISIRLCDSLNQTHRERERTPNCQGNTI